MIDQSKYTHTHTHTHTSIFLAFCTGLSSKNDEFVTGGAWWYAQ